MANTDTERNVKPARPVDHASRMEASRARLVASRKLCLSTEVIIREAHVTVEEPVRTITLLMDRSDIKGVVAKATDAMGQPLWP